MPFASCMVNTQYTSKKKFASIPNTYTLLLNEKKRCLKADKVYGRKEESVNDFWSLNYHKVDMGAHAWELNESISITREICNF